MDRLEKIREIADQYIMKIKDVTIRKFAYVHTYGVAQNATLLAKRRGINVELSCIAAMLHDIALYAYNCSHATHAKQSSILAKEILEDTALFTDDEIMMITNAIALHSNKMERDGGKISELLKDADVLQHYLYNVNIELSAKDKYRLYYLLEEITCAQ